MGNKAVFLDRDGVLNVEKGDYVWKPEDFDIVPGIVDLLHKLKKEGYLLIIITNQAGISKGLYKKEDMLICHDKLQEACANVIDDLYYSPYHPSITESLSRKPDSLMLERAIAKYDVDVHKSWLIGDRGRDVLSGKKLGLKTIQLLSDKEIPMGDHNLESIKEIEAVIFV